MNGTGTPSDTTFGVDVGGTNDFVSFVDAVGSTSYAPRWYQAVSSITQIRHSTVNSGTTFTKISDIATYFSGEAGTTKTIKFLMADNALSSRTGEGQVVSGTPVIALIEIGEY